MCIRNSTFFLTVKQGCTAEIMQWVVWATKGDSLDTVLYTRELFAYVVTAPSPPPSVFYDPVEQLPDAARDIDCERVELSSVVEDIQVLKHENPFGDLSSFDVFQVGDTVHTCSGAFGVVLCVVEPGVYEVLLDSEETSRFYTSDDLSVSCAPAEPLVRGDDVSFCALVCVCSD
jgi:hypothetical protein